MDDNSDRLKQIKERADAATPGPWKEGDYYEAVYSDDNRILADLCGSSECDYIPPRGRYIDDRNYEEAQFRGWDEQRNNAAFIAHARTDIPFLLDAIEAANERITALEMELDALKEIAGDMERIPTLESILRLVLDFFSADTPAFVGKYGAGMSTRDVADRIREVLSLENKE